MGAIKNVIVAIAGIAVVTAGIYLAANYSASKAKTIYEDFAYALSDGDLEDAYAALHPNAQRGIPFEHFKTAFGNFEPIESVTLHDDSAYDNLSGETVSISGCKSTYTMTLVNQSGEMRITKVNFTPICRK